MAEKRWKVGALAVAFAVAACGGDGGPTRAELVGALIDGGLEPTEARCWVGETYEHLSLDDKRAIERADPDYEDFDDPAAVRAAGEKCQS